MNSYAIEVNDLTKRYGQLLAVDHVSLKVKAGTSFGLLGLNGAGKTTTLKMLASLIRPDSGTAKVGGYDVLREPMKVRRNIGYVSENPGFYTRMTTFETLEYLCKLLDIPRNMRKGRIDQNLELVGLQHKRNDYVGTYSRGMRHRLSLAQALLSEPQILFLDEPTLGLDPAGAKGIRNLIIKIKQEHKVTILMSSHVLPEVEAICNEVGIFDHGQLIAQDSVENLRNTASDSMNIEVVLIEPDELVVQALKKLECVNKITRVDNKLLINVKRDTEVRPQIIETIFNINKYILNFGIKESSLEDILLRLIHQRADDK